MTYIATQLHASNFNESILTIPLGEFEDVKQAMQHCQRDAHLEGYGILHWTNGGDRQTATPDELTQYIIERTP